MPSAKQLIIDAFLHRLSTKAFQDISVTDIVSCARISRSTFYLHFTDKYELMDEVRRSLNGRFLEIYKTPAPTETVNHEICRHLFVHRSFYRQEFSDANRIHDLSCSLTGHLRRVFGDDDMAAFSAWGTVGYLALWVRGGFVIGPGEAAEKLMKIVSADWTANLAGARSTLSN